MSVFRFLCKARTLICEKVQYIYEPAILRNQIKKGAKLITLKKRPKIGKFK